ncbi:MAG: peptide chain release factor 1 [Candidatus Zixiibacteriota bacterium]
MLDQIEKLQQRLDHIDLQMSDPAVSTDRKKLIELNRERRHLVDALEIGHRYRKTQSEIAEAKELIATGDDDAEFLEMAQQELEKNEAMAGQLESEFQVKLLPHDPADERPAMVEIRAGTGGDEAGLFAGDLYRMYQRFADAQDWKHEVLSSNPAQSGGFKEIIFSLKGDNAYGTMKFESGVHRVQRVPATETQGRVHTSAATVAVLPEVDDVEVEIKENELKVDVYRSSGPGGQSVNTTDSAVRLTHLPTGLVVTCQDEKSQLKNKTKAMKVLRARLYDMTRAEQQAKLTADRRSMVSTGDRSAKIRTYNFPQNRVTDHRISLTLYKLSAVLEGAVDLLIDELRRHDLEERMQTELNRAAGE